MKTKKFILFATLLFSTVALTAQEPKTMYIMKDDAVTHKITISNIDSIVFYNPIDAGVIINGIKWATRNVAAPRTFAANPEDTGMLYQWNRNVGWSAANPMINSNDGTTWNSSTPTGIVWEKVNDPSPAGWRIPTLDEIKTLLDTNKVTNKWIIINGKNGRKFTDKATGTSIFLPAVGYRLYGSGYLLNSNSEGFYWSNIQFGNNMGYVLAVNFYYDADWGTNNNGNGLSIRCVAE